MPVGEKLVTENFEKPLDNEFVNIWNIVPEKNQSAEMLIPKLSWRQTNKPLCIEKIIDDNYFENFLGGIFSFWQLIIWCRLWRNVIKKQILLWWVSSCSVSLILLEWQVENTASGQG